MMSGGVQVASQEVNRALAELKSVDSASQLTVQLLQKAQQLFTMANQEIDKYVARNSKMMSLNNPEGR